MKIICNDFKANEIIKMIRENMEMTQKEFGKFINRSDKCVQYYEYGLRNYDFEMLLDISKRSNLKITIETK